MPQTAQLVRDIAETPSMSPADGINLVLVYLPGVLDVEDFKQIALRVEAIAGDIAVTIHEDRTPDGALIDRLARRC